MEQQAAVPTQAFLLAIAASLASLLCGPRSGLPNTIILILGLSVCVGLAMAYHVRSRGREKSTDRRAGDRRARWSLALGFGIPLVVSVLRWATPSFDDGIDSAAAAFTAGTVTVGVGMMLVSSMVDWYYVLPTALGRFGRPIWALDDSKLAGQRRVAQVWVFHRGLCELVVLVSLSLFLAIVIVAVGNSFSGDKTLPTAFEALGGTGIAFAAVQYLAPRLNGALDFVLAAPIGLGAWVRWEDARGRERSGLVVDVSIRPGLKVVAQDGLTRYFVPLPEVRTLSAVHPPNTPDQRAAIVERHFGQKPPQPETATAVVGPPQPQE